MTEKECVEYVNKYVGVYTIIKKIEEMQKYVEEKVGKDSPVISIAALTTETIIKLIKESDMITEKDIIQSYSKDLLIACYDEWDEERKDKEDARDILRKVIKKVLDTACEEFREEDENEK